MYSWVPRANKSYSFYKYMNLNVGGLLGAAIISLYSCAARSEGKDAQLLPKHSEQLLRNISIERIVFWSSSQWQRLIFC